MEKYYYQILDGNCRVLKNSYEFGKWFATAKDCRQELKKHLKEAKVKGLKFRGMVINSNNKNTYVGQIEANFNETTEDEEIKSTVD